MINKYLTVIVITTYFNMCIKMVSGWGIYGGGVVWYMCCVRSRRGLGGGGRQACKHLRWLNCWLQFSGPWQKSVRWIVRQRFSCRWQRSVDCVFCAVNNKVRTYARGKLMSNHKDLGKSFASGHGLFTLAGRGRALGTRGKRRYCKAGELLILLTLFYNTEQITIKDKFASKRINSNTERFCWKNEK